jgi:hypothetical protein
LAQANALEPLCAIFSPLISLPDHSIAEGIGVQENRVKRQERQSVYSTRSTLEASKREKRQSVDFACSTPRQSVKSIKASIPPARPRKRQKRQSVYSARSTPEASSQKRQSVYSARSTLGSLKASKASKRLFRPLDPRSVEASNASKRVLRNFRPRSFKAPIPVLEASKRQSVYCAI